MAETSLLQVQIDTELKQAAAHHQVIPFPITHPIGSAEETKDGSKVWQGLTPGMENPIHIGEGFRMYSKEELHER